MDNTAFSAGVVPGGLTTHREIKILICCILQNIKAPVSHELLMEALSGDGMVNYFEAADAISDLVELNHISDKNGYYEINETGEQIADLLRTDIPLSVREKVISKAARLYRRQVNSAQHKVEIIERDDGFVVRGSISDFGTELFAIEIYAPNRLHAENIKSNFIDKGTDIMRDALSRLVVPAEEL